MCRRDFKVSCRVGKCVFILPMHIVATQYTTTQVHD